MANKIRVNVNGEAMIFEGVRRVAYDNPDIEDAQVYFVAENELMPEKVLTANGTYTPPANMQAFKKVIVNVPSDAITKFDFQAVVGATFNVPYTADTDEVRITPEGLLSYYDDGDGYFIFTALAEGFATIDLMHADEAERGYEVNIISEDNIILPYGYVKPSGKLTITENGTYNVRNFEAVDVNIIGGHTVKISGAYRDDNYESALEYSLDSGGTWIPVTDENNVIENVTQIRFRSVTGYNSYDWYYYTTDTEIPEDAEIWEYGTEFDANVDYAITKDTVFEVTVDW